ncbi:MAG: ABC transporter ATP-binding protein [Microbacteriaceae bacterium]
MMNSAPAVQIDRLRVRRGGRDVLENISLTIPSGQVVGLLGPSGCGKTTLMRAIVGVQIVAGGDLSVLASPAGSATLRNRVGYVTQAPSVYDDLTVKQNLIFFRRILGADRGSIDRVIAATDLGAHAGELVGNLSGGERSRVSLAIALLITPELLVLDEPTVGLDPVLRAELWALFHSLAAAGTSLLVSSHVMDEATRCDRLLLMRDGRILADDTPDGLLAATGADTIEGAFLELIRRHPKHAVSGGEA